MGGNLQRFTHLNRQFGSVRFAYNAGLRIMSHRYKRHSQSLSAKHDIKKLLPVAKKSRKYNWLKEVDSIALQQSCINLDKAFQRFFDPKQKAMSQLAVAHSYTPATPLDKSMG